MNTYIDNINNIFTKYFSYSYLNLFSDIKLRNRNLQLTNAVKFIFKYSKLNTTQSSVKSDINYSNDSTFERTTYVKKVNNIPVEWFSSLFYSISALSKNIIKSPVNNNYISISIDGTNSNDKSYNVSLNMGYYNIDKNIPISLISEGNKNRNKEVKCSIQFIDKHIDLFKNSIIVADRLYFNYEIMDYCIRNKIKFIIRCKGNADYLAGNKDISKYIKNSNLIKSISKKVKVIKYTDSYTKTVFNKGKYGQKNKKYKLQITNDCVLVTNLLKSKEEDILNSYRNRWKIETYFKFIKKNFKIQYEKTNNKEFIQKIHYCIVIMSTIISTLIYLSNKQNSDVNMSLLLDGIFNTNFLDNLLAGKLDIKLTEKLIKAYMANTNNKPDRHFPRQSKDRSSRWYTKQYSNSAELIKIIDCILNNTLKNLDKNKKLKAKHIKILEVTDIN